MSTKKMIALLMFCILFSCAYSNSYAVGETGGKQETTINKQIDTKNLSGINLWIANMYNNDRLLYAIVVTTVMALLGSIMAFGTDLVLKYFGISVSKISHSE